MLKRNRSRERRPKTLFKKDTTMIKPFATGTAGFSPIELRGVCEYRPGFGHIEDLRSLGCPDHIFQRLVEKRAKALGIHTPAPALTDSQLRAKAARIGETLDAERANAEVQKLLLREL